MISFRCNGFMARSGFGIGYFSRTHLVLYVRPGISRNGRRSQEPVASYSGITLGYQVKERLQMTQKIELPEGWFMKLVDGVIEDRKKMCPELRKFYDELAQAILPSSLPSKGDLNADRGDRKP